MIVNRNEAYILGEVSTDVRTRSHTSNSFSDFEDVESQVPSTHLEQFSSHDEEDGPYQNID